MPNSHVADSPSVFPDTGQITERCKQNTSTTPLGWSKPFNAACALDGRKAPTGTRLSPRRPPTHSSVREVLPELLHVRRRLQVGLAPALVVHEILAHQASGAPALPRYSRSSAVCPHLSPAGAGVCCPHCPRAACVQGKIAPGSSFCRHRRLIARSFMAGRSSAPRLQVSAFVLSVMAFARVSIH